jgi:hypothetical protein
MWMSPAQPARPHSLLRNYGPHHQAPRSGAGLYAASFRRGAALARGGSTGAPLYDFFMGRELNPRLGGLDLKEFCELYPGLLGWLLIDLGMAHKQLQARARAGGRHSGRLAASLRDAPALVRSQHLCFLVAAGFVGTSLLAWHKVVVTWYDAHHLCIQYLSSGRRPCPCAPREPGSPVRAG